MSYTKTETRRMFHDKFTALQPQYRRLAQAAVRRYVPIGADRESVEQEILLKIWSECQKRPVTVALAFTIARRVCADIYKRDERRLHDSLDQEMFPTDRKPFQPAAEVMFEDARSEVVRKAVDSLPPEHKEVITRVFWGCETVVSIARAEHRDCTKLSNLLREAVNLVGAALGLRSKITSLQGKLLQRRCDGKAKGYADKQDHLREAMRRDFGKCGHLTLYREQLSSGHCVYTHRWLSGGDEEEFWNIEADRWTQLSRKEVRICPTCPPGTPTAGRRNRSA